MSGGRLRLFPASTWYWARRRGPGRLDLHRHGLRTLGQLDMAPLPQSSVIFTTWGLTDCPALPWTVTRHLGGGHFQADRERRASACRRSGRARCPALADSAGWRRRLRRRSARHAPQGYPGRQGPRRCWSKPSRAAGAKANKPRRAPIGSNNGLGRCRPRRWSSSRSPPSRGRSQRPVARPSLFNDADGTSKREALRQWHMGVVRPLARMLSAELTEKFNTAITLKFDNYPLDLIGRAQAFQKLVAGGVAVNEALATSGLLADDD